MERGITCKKGRVEGRVGGIEKEEVMDTCKDLFLFMHMPPSYLLEYEASRRSKIQEEENDEEERRSNGEEEPLGAHLPPPPPHGLSRDGGEAVRVAEPLVQGRVREQPQLRRRVPERALRRGPLPRLSPEVLLYSQLLN